MPRSIIICIKCKKRVKLHARNCCQKCYLKHLWNKKKIICSECNRERPHGGKGLCTSCFNKIYHYDNILASNARIYHGIDLELYRKVTKRCLSCNFDKVVQIHHIDGNTRNNNLDNIMGLCPNCHRMVHMYKFHDKIQGNLKENGYDISLVHPKYLLRNKGSTKKRPFLNQTTITLNLPKT